MHVYKITNTVDNKLYIGVTQCSIAKRWREHRCAAKCGVDRLLYRAMRRHGEAAFRIEVVYEATSQQEMFAVERGLIAAYGTRNRSLGYNLTLGGDSGPGVWFEGETNSRSMLTDAAVAFIRDPQKKLVCNDDMRFVVREQFGIIVSRDCIRDARRGSSWKHLNGKYLPIHIGQGNRITERRRIASGNTLRLPHVRAASIAVSTIRLKTTKIAARLTPEQARAIYLDTRPNRAIERAYGVSHGVAGDIKKRRTWADVTKGLCHAE